MALVSCSECGRQVSTQAVACPACGAPVSGGSAGREGKAPASTGVWGKVVAAIAAWLVVPWLVRALAFVAGIAMLIVMFRSAR